MLVPDDGQYKLCLGKSTGGPQRWRVAKLTVTDKLKINNPMLLLSSTDGPLSRYMHVFGIMQNIQEKFRSGIMHGFMSL